MFNSLPLHAAVAPLLAWDWLSPAGLGVIALVVTVMILFSLLVLVSSQYKRCPSNRILVIYGNAGKGQACRTIHGGAAFVMPLTQDYAYLSLEPIQIEVPLRGALSIENIRVNVPSVFTVAIGTSPEVMQNAAVRLLGLNNAAIQKQAEEIIFGQLRQVIASMRIEDINRDRDTFLEHVQKSLEPELKKVGLVLINVNITDITDESGYIDAIGQKAASQAIQQARGDVAEELRQGETRVAEADRDKAIQVAGARRTMEIGTREAQREQAVRIAEIEKEKSIGEQTSQYERDAIIKDSERKMRIAMAEAQRDQAVRVAELEKEQNIGEQAARFERDALVKDSERKMRIAMADANAKAVAGENESAAAVAASAATLAVKKADAYELSETRRREAEAAVVEAQNRAMAKAALADAERVEAEQRAALEAPAKAEKAKAIVDAQAAAECRKLEAEAEAQAVYVKLEAEARGQFEILAKKGQGLKEIINACGGSQQAFQMMMLEHLDNLAEASAKAISNIKFDKIVVWDQGGQSGTTNTSNFLQGMARTLPPMMQVMQDIGGVQFPESLVKFSEAGAAPPAYDGPAAAPVSPGPRFDTNGGTAHAE